MRQTYNGLVDGVSARAIVAGTLISLALTPTMRSLTGAIGFQQFNFIAPTGADFRGWIMLSLLTVATTGVGAYAASYINRPISAAVGTLQGVLVWAAVATTRWLLALLNLTPAARTIDASSPIFLWVAVFANLIALVIAMYFGWLGAAENSIRASKGRREHRTNAHHPSPQH